MSTQAPLPIPTNSSLRTRYYPRDSTPPSHFSLGTTPGSLVSPFGSPRIPFSPEQTRELFGLPTGTMIGKKRATVDMAFSPYAPFIRSAMKKARMNTNNLSSSPNLLAMGQQHELQELHHDEFREAVRRVEGHGLGMVQLPLEMEAGSVDAVPQLTVFGPPMGSGSDVNQESSLFLSDFDVDVWAVRDPTWDDDDDDQASGNWTMSEEDGGSDDDVYNDGSAGEPPLFGGNFARTASHSSLIVGSPEQPGLAQLSLRGTSDSNRKKKSGGAVRKPRKESDTTGKSNEVEQSNESFKKEIEPGMLRTDDDTFSQSRLAEIYGLPGRFRDYKRSLFDNHKMKAPQLEFMETDVEHRELTLRLPHRITAGQFAFRILLMGFHFGLRDGRHPSFWKKLNYEMLFSCLPEDAVIRLLPEVGIHAHSAVDAGMDMATAVKQAQEEAKGRHAKKKTGLC